MTISGNSESRTGGSADLAAGGSAACVLQAANTASDETTSARASVRTQTFLLSIVATSLYGHELEMAQGV